MVRGAHKRTKERERVLVGLVWFLIFRDGGGRDD